MHLILVELTSSEYPPGNLCSEFRMCYKLVSVKGPRYGGLQLETIFRGMLIARFVLFSFNLVWFPIDRLLGRFPSLHA